MNVNNGVQIPERVVRSSNPDTHYQHTYPAYGLPAHALKPGVTLEQAIAKTQGNGLDEVFFTQGDKLYVASSEKLGLHAQAHIQNLEFVDFKGEPAKVLHVNAEANTSEEGVVTTFKLMKNAVIKPFSYIDIPNKATAATFVGGIVLGALSQGAWGTTAKAGLALGGLSGASTIRYLTEPGVDSPAKAAKAGLTGTAAVAIGAAIPHGIQWMTQTSLPQALAIGAKNTLVAVTLGAGIALIGGGLTGAFSRPDYQALKEITE